MLSRILHFFAVRIVEGGVRGGFGENQELNSVAVSVRFVPMSRDAKLAQQWKVAQRLYGGVGNFMMACMLSADTPEDITRELVEAAGVHNDLPEDITRDSDLWEVAHRRFESVDAFRRACILNLNSPDMILGDNAQHSPGSARPCLEKPRCMYENTVHVNFIELSADHRLEPEEFRVLLENVQGVRQVTLHDKSKADQGNLGAQDPKHRTPRREHYRAHNFMVFSTLFPNDCRGMEFELTESLHMKRACYKVQGTLDRSLEAWRILRTAVSGKQLHSNIVSKFEEELKVLTNASMDKPTVFSNSHETAASMQPPPQTPTLVELQSRNDALGCAGSSSSGVGLQPGSTSSSANQQVHRPLSSPASKKTLASSLPQVLHGYRNGEKIRIQVTSALEILSASTRTIMHMEEILKRPGASVLESIFSAANKEKKIDPHTPVQNIAVID